MAKADLAKAMAEGTDKWEDTVPDKNFDKLPEYKKDGDKYKFKGENFENYAKDVLAQGYIEEFWGEERCFSGMINNPGISLLPNGLMGPLYVIFLGFLFLGIAISADIFMEAIDVITS